MNLYDLIELSQLRAIQVALEPTEESLWNLRLREYAEVFRTPLHEVARLNPEFILQHLYEHKYNYSEVKHEIEDILEKLYQIKDPAYTKITEADTEALVDAVLNHELKRRGKQKITSEKETALPQNKIMGPIKEVNFPKKGGMKFDDLEKMESEIERTRSGFEE